MAADGAFTADEVGSGNCATLTAFDWAFLDGPPAYEETPAFLWDVPEIQPRFPSPERRAFARRLFLAIGGSATLVLVLALLRMLYGALFS